MKLTKKDIYSLCDCVETIQNSSFLGLYNNNIDIHNIGQIIESVTNIKILDIENLSVVWQNNGFEDEKMYYYKEYKVTLITNDIFKVTLYADKNFDITNIIFNMGAIVVKL